MGVDFEPSGPRAFLSRAGAEKEWENGEKNCRVTEEMLDAKVIKSPQASEQIRGIGQVKHHILMREP